MLRHLPYHYVVIEPTIVHRVKLYHRMRMQAKRDWKVETNRESLRVSGAELGEHGTLDYLYYKFRIDRVYEQNP